MIAYLELTLNQPRQKSISKTQYVSCYEVEMDVEYNIAKHMVKGDVLIFDGTIDTIKFVIACDIKYEDLEGKAFKIKKRIFNQNCLSIYAEED